MEKYGRMGEEKVVSKCHLTFSKVPWLQRKQKQEEKENEIFTKTKRVKL